MSTGARQTGKTTLARRLFLELRHLDLDDLERRHFVRDIGAAAWPKQVGAAVLDEAQKEPSPKLVGLDAGIRRQGMGQWVPPDGAHFESVVVAEAWKWVSTAGLDVQLSFHGSSSSSGLEVDLLA